MGYMGFQKVAKSTGKPAKQADAIAAAVGRRKYGKAAMAKMAAEGRKRASKS